MPPRDTVLTDSHQFAATPHANYDVMAGGKTFLAIEGASERTLIVVEVGASVLRSPMQGTR